MPTDPLPRPFAIGDRIIEIHPQADPRVIEGMVEGQYILVRGVITGRRTRIAWKRINRYRLDSRSV